MQTYIFYFTMLFLIVIHAQMDADLFKKNKGYINAKQAFNVFCFTVVFSMFILFDGYVMPFTKWVAFCLVTTFLLRAGFYDFIFNKFCGLNMWSVNTKSLTAYDKFLLRLHIHPVESRIVCSVLAVLWLFFHQDILS